MPIQKIRQAIPTSACAGVLRGQVTAQQHNYLSLRATPPPREPKEAVSVDSPPTPPYHQRWTAEGIAESTRILSKYGPLRKPEGAAEVEKVLQSYFTFQTSEGIRKPRGCRFLDVRPAALRKPKAPVEVKNVLQPSSNFQSSEGIRKPRGCRFLDVRPAALRNSSALRSNCASTQQYANPATTAAHVTSAVASSMERPTTSKPSAALQSHWPLMLQRFVQAPKETMVSTLKSSTSRVLEKPIDTVATMEPDDMTVPGSDNTLPYLGLNEQVEEPGTLSRLGLAFELDMDMAARCYRDGKLPPARLTVEDTVLDLRMDVAMEAAWMKRQNVGKSEEEKNFIYWDVCAKIWNRWTARQKKKADQAATHCPTEACGAPRKEERPHRRAEVETPTPFDEEQTVTSLITSTISSLVSRGWDAVRRRLFH